MEAAAACVIDRLPEDLLAAIISLTSPLDACRAATVSRTFRTAADSDAVWSRFLPGAIPRRFVPSELCSSCMPPSRKPLFLCLSGHPVLFPVPDTPMSMWLDRVTAATCYALPARALQISGADEPHHWRWIHSVDPHVNTTRRNSQQRSIWMSEAAELLDIADLEISCKIHSRMLSENSAYAAYMVFIVADTGSCGLDYPFQEASLTVAGGETTRQACLHGYVDLWDGAGMVPRKHVTQYILGGRIRTLSVGEGVLLPRRRVDGWMELELGEFSSQEGGDGEVSMSLTGTKLPYLKRGLIVRGIEIRAKQRGQMP